MAVVVAASSQAAVRGGDDICDVLEDVLADAADLVEEVAWDAATSHLDQMRERAAADPRWVDLAGALDMWADPKGNIAFGVRNDHPLAHEAFAAEYGDPHNAPAPLVRMGLRSSVVDMGWSMQEAFQRFGY
jgi:hypothetical protein